MSRGAAFAIFLAGLLLSLVISLVTDSFVFLLLLPLVFWSTSRSRG